ncbi:phosphate ABC transporter substrate-binding protein PstS [Thermogladius sp.]|uniref:phosphate ABC transporter substrate-binding protein PstS n=1 Tax=Thermogladius sp. TaxID=2023064 RepID=UPI003D11E376
MPILVIAVIVLGAAWYYMVGKTYPRAPYTGQTSPSPTYSSPTPTTLPLNIVLNGAGSTLQAPLVQYWARLFQQETGVQVNYQGVGSGAGISMFLAGTTDFAGSDVPLPHDVYKNYEGRVLQLPITVGVVVVVYNIPEIPREVHLNITGCILAEVLRGNVTRWNDPAIKSLNPAVADKLPDKDIVVVYRSDKSGTTNILTTYLSRSCPSLWPSNLVGLSMPTFVTESSRAIGAKGSDGLTLAVKNNPYTLGYVEVQYALSSGLQYAASQNREGFFVLPTPSGVSAAVESVIDKLPSTVRADWSQSSSEVICAPGNNSYPLVTFTYQLFWASYSDKSKQEAVNLWIRFILTKGQENAVEGFYPLPQRLVSELLTSLTQGA